MIKVGGGGSVIYVFFIIIIYYLLFYLVLGAKYQLGHCPVSCSSCNIVYFILIYFSNEFDILIYILLDRMQQGQ